MVSRAIRSFFLFSLLVAIAIPSFAQQTGALHGRVTATDNSVLPGVTVEARSNVLPQPRVTTTDANGEYRLPALVPGTYTVTYTLAGMQTSTRNVEVLLRADRAIDVKLGVAAVSENITVTAEATMVNRESTALQEGFTSKQIRDLPLQQDYRDLQKLIPGVMYTQDAVRGPSAGASGQDNVYMFDGVNITMPLFGVLNAEPNTHDIAQVNIIRGGAKATEFDRAGGFQIDSVSKSGTNKYTGELSYQALNKNFVASQTGSQNLTYDQNRSWTTANIGGPVLPDRMFFYGSFYRPISKRSNQANVYGSLPGYELRRSDEFGKITLTPVSAWLINASYRNSHTTETASAFGAFQAPTTGTGSKTSQKLGTFETSWVINPKSFASAKFTDWRNPGFGTADQLASVTPNFAVGTQLDIANLGTQGRLVIPVPTAATAAFLAPFINQYGFPCPATSTCTPGSKVGGSTVGFGQFARDDDSFYRKNVQATYNLTLGSSITHDLHVGGQWHKDSEDRFQLSNGWGVITIPAGVGVAGTCPASACGAATPAFFVAQVSQQGARGVPTIHSEVAVKNLEFNDTIHMNNWAFNVGLLASQDTLYGQGLARADNFAGYVTSPGTKYLMHKFDFKDMLQPRLGATWAYNGSDTVYASFARYMSEANSDARAASWDRNLVQQLNVYFDATGKLIGSAPNASSSGKWWQSGIKHPDVKEWMIGTGQQITNRWSSRIYGRYRKGGHFLEDTNNTARADFGSPAGVPKGDYVPDLCNTSLSTCGPNTIRGSIGSGSTYVIANLDGAFTKYLEATTESEWRGDNMTVGGSYTWSHYYGNFDQDNSTFSSANDQATFIGSSNIGDGPGRQIWDMKYGNLRGDRRHIVKVNASYSLPWHASVGGFGVYQSGQPYQLESVLPYRPLTGSTSDTNRYAEQAGSRLSPSHRQLDAKYTQDIPIHGRFGLQLVADVFNVFNSQTGYNYETRIGALGIIKLATNPGVETVPVPTSISDTVLRTVVSAQTDPNFNRADYAVRAPFANSFYAPRRYQLTARITF
jgi:hypothetical protein